MVNAVFSSSKQLFVSLDTPDSVGGGGGGGGGGEEEEEEEEPGGGGGQDEEEALWLLMVVVVERERMCNVFGFLVQQLLTVC